MKKISLVGCRLRDDGNLDIPTKNLKECKIIEDELFELVGCEGDTWSGKKVIVHEFCDGEYQKAIPIEKVNLWALIMNKCKRIEGYMPDPNNDYTKDNSLRELYERRMIPQTVKKIDISKLRIQKNADCEHTEVSPTTVAN